MFHSVYSRWTWLGSFQQANYQLQFKWRVSGISCLSHQHHSSTLHSIVPVIIGWSSSSFGLDVSWWLVSKWSKQYTYIYIHIVGTPKEAFLQPAQPFPQNPPRPDPLMPLSDEVCLSSGRVDDRSQVRVGSGCLGQCLGAMLPTEQQT